MVTLEYLKRKSTLDIKTIQRFIPIVVPDDESFMMAKDLYINLLETLIQDLKNSHVKQGNPIRQGTSETF